MRQRLTPMHRMIVCQSELFASLPRDHAERLIDEAQVKTLPRGQTLFHHGDIAHSIHIVTEGWIKLFRIAPSGTEAVVGMMTCGESFGEPIALRRAAYPVSAEASTAAELLVVPAQALLDLLLAHPETAISVLSAASGQLLDLVEQIEQLKARSGAQRLAEFLLELCPEGAESATVTLPYDKALIAGRLGMKPESLSRAFARLRDFGVMVNQTNAAIASVSALREMVHDDGAGLFSRAI